MEEFQCIINYCNIFFLLAAFKNLIPPFSIEILNRSYKKGIRMGIRKEWIKLNNSRMSCQQQ